MIGTDTAERHSRAATHVFMFVTKPTRQLGQNVAACRANKSKRPDGLPALIVIPTVQMAHKLINYSLSNRRNSVFSYLISGLRANISISTSELIEKLLLSASRHICIWIFCCELSGERVL